ncbi:MAG: tRNA pseudouridine(38-40) synthase TruA [Gammaproteobacteria bacterium]|nr:tRNA pseudouridine(38-40) synthase TruA [Gammaproteobacteria bacterium]
MRVVMGVEYLGAAYHGFQFQENCLSIQQVVEEALGKVANHQVKIVCAGRTDAGVHAVEQVIHFDTEAARTPRAWVFGANGYLPKDISVRWMRHVPETFHARFSALQRRYYYVIYNHPIRPALLRERVAWHCRPLDVEKMQEAANYWWGQHDFSSFRAAACQAKTAVRTLYDLTIFRKNDFVVVTVQADAFLHHMVRNFVGVLLAVGEGAQSPSWAKVVLDACDRTAGGKTAPAEGLYLYNISYPELFQLPEPVRFFEFL